MNNVWCKTEKKCIGYLGRPLIRSTICKPPPLFTPLSPNSSLNRLQNYKINVLCTFFILKELGQSQQKAKLITSAWKHPSVVCNLKPDFQFLQYFDFIIGKKFHRLLPVASFCPLKNFSGPLVSRYRLWKYKRQSISITEF